MSAASRCWRTPGRRTRAALCLVGDSYAFIGLTQILSAVFARVTFIWSAAVDWS